MFFRSAFYGIVGAMVVGGLSLAAERPVSTHKSDRELSRKAPGAAPIVPQGTVTFGESAAPSPAAQHRARLRWPEMTQKEIDDLTATLKAVAKTRGAPVAIVCKDPMCEDLALNLDNAFESARWKSEIVIGTVFGVPEGVTTSSQWLADLFNAATGNRYGAKVVSEKVADGEAIMIGAKPRGDR
jgi:hypothetical protein